MLTPYVLCAFLQNGSSTDLTITLYHATGSPVQSWHGFVAMITTGYFEKRWAWYPIERLQMELKATRGKATQPALVSEWAGIVYATLEAVAPQFPSS